MTDLEAHVNAEGRDKLVKQVREKINELGVNYIYYQFISCKFSHRIHLTSLSKF